MVVAVAVVRMMKMLAHQIINVVSVWNCGVAAIWTMNMTLLVQTTLVGGCAVSGVLLADWNYMFRHLAAIFLMIHFSLVEIIDVSFVLDLDAPAFWTMDVCRLLSHDISPCFGGGSV